MARWLQFGLFLLMILLFVGGSHFYVWRRFVHDTALPAPWRQVGLWLVVGLALTLPASFLVSRLLSPEVARWVLFLPYFWMGMLVLTLFLLGLADLGRFGTWVWSKAAHATYWLEDPARRLAWFRWGALAAGGAALVASVVGMYFALRAPVVVRHEVELPRLPQELDGLKLAQLSDLHLGPTLGREWLEEVVRRTNELEPDVVAITGDLVDGDVETLRDVVAPLGDLKARYGVFFVTGNHEYYSGVGGWLDHLPTLGIRVLHNEHARVGPAGAPLVVAGIDDHSSRGFAAGHGPDLAAALRGVTGEPPIVLLAHQPKAVHEASERGVGLVLSGHTHGGQFYPWAPLVYLQQPEISGLHRYGETWLYVSDGTGFWGPALRLGTTGEITLLTLRAPR
jgi:hypothetical protein